LRRTAAAIAAAAVVGGAAAAFAAGSLQQDFAAYWVAGAARRLGLDPYLNHVGSAEAPRLWDGSPFVHSRFLYPPLVAELFRPLAALPYRVAKGLFTAGALAALVAAAALGTDRAGNPRRVPEPSREGLRSASRASSTRGRPERRAADPRAMLIAAALAFPVYLHLDRGQIDLYALPLLLAAWRLRRRALAAGALFAAAALLKPALVGALPVLAVLGHRRWAAAAVGAAAALAALTVVISGPALAGRYATAVLPRASLYGEGGTEAMLLPLHEADFQRLGFPDDDDDVQVMDGRAYAPSLLERTLPFEVRASASLPRLLAPRAPSRAAAVAPYALVTLALAAAARALARRRRDDDDDARAAEALLYLAAIVACVVTSPVGWVMGFVWALPMLQPAAALHAAGRLPRRAALALGAAAIACALPAPFAGAGALAGVALVATAAGAALAADAPPEIGT
jgi:hypothetical protein